MNISFVTSQVGLVRMQLELEQFDLSAIFLLFVQVPYALVTTYLKLKRWFLQTTWVQHLANIVHAT